jgi:lipopolysaccharide biosynthesis glycosyltransferase
MRQNPQYIRWYDQDGLNAILADKWAELDPRWNRTPQIYSYSSWEDSPFQEAEFRSLISSPYVVHFATTGRKPWNDLKYPDGDIFYKYLDMTAWAGWRYTRWRSLQHRILISWRKFKRRLIQQGFS